MCFGGREKDDAGAARSRELDKVIRQDEKRMAKEVKLLLLGMHAPRSRHSCHALHLD
jgi:guanine nucleotide-binding protein subunit alpha